MKKIVLMGFAFLMGVTFSPTQAKTLQISRQLQPYIYPNLKPKSRWCKVMQASTCASVKGVEKYIDKGCIDDATKESKCLKIFCRKNCAWKCDRGLNLPCQTYCTKVSLGTYEDQAALHACYPNTLTPVQAATKDLLRLKARQASGSAIEAAERRLQDFTAKQARGEKDRKHQAHLDQVLKDKKNQREQARLNQQRKAQEERARLQQERAQRNYNVTPSFYTGLSTVDREEPEEPRPSLETSRPTFARPRVPSKPTYSQRREYIEEPQENTYEEYSTANTSSSDDPYVDPYADDEKPLGFGARRGW